ncbi:MAG: hypothetical protein IPN68_09245 [Bacteroidetes bacterium]|nr:hypothetical protein [Bacteroidota bacterium]
MNSKPVATGLSVTPSTISVGTTLTGHYSVDDPDPADDPTAYATFRWLRTGGMPIPGATGDMYTLTAADEGYTITFEVTPHSTTGYPTTGDIALCSTATFVPVDPLSPKPIATDVCIQGIRAWADVNSKIYFTHLQGQKALQFENGIWELLKLVPGWTYPIVNASDISSSQEITFKVTPVSDNNPIDISGPTITSAPLARITLSQVDYQETVESVPLTANVSGGVFSGPHVTDGIFSPKDAGIPGSPYTINYNYSIINTSNTCSQQASKNLSVSIATTSFSTVNPVYCSDDAPFLVTVQALPVGSRPYPYIPQYYGFYVNSAYGDQSAVGSEVIPDPYPGGNPKWSVMIDPSKLNPGYNYLYLYYFDDPSYTRLYLLSAVFQVEKVGTITEISNLNSAYCAEDNIQDIQVYGLYPRGTGEYATWTGDILTNKTSLIAKVNPSSGTPGQVYPITYQFTTAKGCKSNILTKNVTINPMPDASFNIDPLFDLNGNGVQLEPVTVPEISYEASFVGPGVIKVEDSPGIFVYKFLPGIAEEGPKTLGYKVTTDKGCYDEKTQTTNVEKATGTFNGIPSKICYSDQTFNISVSDLPDGTYACDPVNFRNAKNSLVWTPGTVNAQYNVAAAGAGYDTLFFTYKKQNVNFTIKKSCVY